MFAFWLSTVTHEIGHTLASLLVRQPVKSVRIWSSSDSHTKLTFRIKGINISSSLKFPRGESLGFTEQLDTPLPVKFVLFFAFGGVISNFLAFLLGFIVFLTFANTLKLLPGGNYWLIFIYVFLVFNLTSATANITPFPGADGWHIQNVFRYRNEHKKVIYHTHPRPVFLKYDGFYKEFPIPSEHRKLATFIYSLPTIFILIAFCAIAIHFL